MKYRVTIRAGKVVGSPEENTLKLKLYGERPTLSGKRSITLNVNEEMENNPSALDDGEEISVIIEREDIGKILSLQATQQSTNPAGGFYLESINIQRLPGYFDEFDMRMYPSFFSHNQWFSQETIELTCSGLSYYPIESEHGNFTIKAVHSFDHIKRIKVGGKKTYQSAIEPQETVLDESKGTVFVCERAYVADELFNHLFCHPYEFSETLAYQCAQERRDIQVGNFTFEALQEYCGTCLLDIRHIVANRIRQAEADYMNQTYFMLYENETDEEITLHQVYEKVRLEGTFKLGSGVFVFPLFDIVIPVALKTDEEIRYHETLVDELYN